LPGHDVNYQAWAGALAPEGGAGQISPLPVADLAAGLTAAFGICAAVLGRAATGTGSYLDVSMTDVLATWTGRARSSDEGASASGPVPGYGLFTTADGGQIALGVLSEQHFWSALCSELGLEELGTLDFAARSSRGAELQHAISAAIAAQKRDDLVDALVAANVPVAPVLDRTGMLASAPFPPFPIRLGPADAQRPVPAVDEHRGQGFAPRP
jgi:crotonobetainyl-CoA:carnitine CoA-transferase CaiB-like acyl-CoA transferase